VSEPAQEEGQDSFLVLFTTLSLILLAFFIFMKTLATPDEERTLRALSSIRTSFDWLTLGGIYPSDSSVEASSNMIAEQEQSYRRLHEELVEIVTRRSIGTGNDVQVVSNDRETRIRFSQNLLFNKNVTVLNPRCFPVLDRVSEFLQGLGREVVVEGHSDPSGADVNWEVSSLRAAAVARYLDESLGTDASDITSRGLSHYHPSTSAFAHSRRVEIVVPNRRHER
jgi:flagellar motor protein MotB